MADFAGHWLHRAQVSLLTGKIGQIKLSHIRKIPGAGLVRALLAKSPRTVTRAETCAEEELVCLTHQQAATPVRGVSNTPTPKSQKKLLQTAGTPRRTCEGALRSTTPLRFAPAPRQLALALVRSSNGPGGKRSGQRGCHPVPGRQSYRRAGLQAGQQRAGAGNSAPRRPWTPPPRQGGRQRAGLSAFHAVDGCTFTATSGGVSTGSV